MAPVTKARIRCEDAMEVASCFMREVADVVERIEIAGSLRRRVYAIKDIEFVLVPRFGLAQPPLFEPVLDRSQPPRPVKPWKPENLFIARLKEMLGDRRASQPELTCFGEKVQRIVYHGVQIECYGVIGEAQWAVAHAIRTGPAEYSRKLVTRRCEGGFLPDDMKVEGLQLWRIHHGMYQYQRVPLADDERAFFHALGFKRVPDPHDRLVVPSEACGDGRI